MENNGGMSIIEALNHVQSWLNKGEYDNVIQGCREILEIEPGNVRALSLMKQAEERRHAAVTNQPMPEPEATPEPKAEPAPMPFTPDNDPLASLEVEQPASKSVQAEPEVTLPEMDDGSDDYEKKKLLIAMLVPAVAVVLIGGGLIWWLANWDREETIEDAVTDEDDEQVEQDLDYLDENQKRVDDISQMIPIIEAYKAENGAYPSVSQIEQVLAEDENLDEIPSDPRQGEIDRSGKPFGYVYAVYDGIGGENTVYILSALFEDSSGFATAWAQGAPVKNYPDYRDFKESNVTFIGGDEKDVEDLLDDLKVDTDKNGEKGDEDKNKVDTSDGPKVNPENN